jgi:UDP-galactopyranose mutase
MDHIDDLLVFSHLRWNFVYQRPQHLLARFAAKHRVIFIEEPELGDSNRLRIEQPQKNLFVCTPIVQNGTVTIPAIVDEIHSQLQPRNYAAWFYTPLALDWMENLQPVVTVYDCMDELSAFANASQRLAAKEHELLKRADLVFTGGVSLYRHKKDRHPRVYCFPSSVDLAHFAQAKQSGDHPLQANLPHPRLGFFGVIDERMDLNLLRAIAEAHPEWSIVMVGPVVKIDPATLPQAPNIHYMGKQEYASLPAFLSGWDVCLMPFALNAATKFISPTKTLEYMAAEKMIVSTPITDVAEPYKDSVYIANGADEFIRACEHALSVSDQEKHSRIEKMRNTLSKTSWDSTVSRMSVLIDSAAASRAQSRRKRQHSQTVIVGAGPTGLSAAYHLQHDYALVERNSDIGGWCRSIQANGFTFDYVGHIMFSNEPYVHRMYKILLGDNVHWQDREAWIYSKGVYTRYPFQGSLYGLPPEVIKECLVGAIEARFGAAKKPVTNGHPLVEDCCGDGILESTAAACGISAREAQKDPKNFAEFIYKVWGAGIAKHFAIPYNRKLWAVPLEQMETSWLGGRVPLPDIGEMIDGALSPSPKPMGPNARFGYPLQGGFQALVNGFLPHLKGDILLNSNVTGVSPSKKTVTLGDGRMLQYDHLISTMPLPALIRRMGSEAPRDIQEAASGLRHTSVRGVHIGVGRPNITEKHWIYYPEDTVFHRIFVQGNASPFCNPPGGFGFTCEITYGPRKPLPCDGEELTQLCIRDAIRCGFIREDDPIWATAQVDLPFAYVIYDHGRAERVREIRAWLEEHDIIPAGRYGEWEYYNSDHAFIAGKNAAEAVRERQSSRQAPMRISEPADVR